MAFKYKERSAETVKARANQQGGDYDSCWAPDVQMFKPKVGNNTVRILPPTWSAKEWGDNWAIEIWKHQNVGADNQSYLCPQKMKGEDCVLCDAVGDLDPKLAKRLKAKKRVACFIIDRDNEKEGPKVWEMGWSIEKDIALCSIDKKTDAVIAIDHPEEGYDIDFVRDGEGLKTKYRAVTVSRDESPISENEKKQDKWLQYIEDNPLPELLVFHDQDHIKKVFGGKVAGGDDDDEPEKAKRGSRQAETEEDEDRPRRSRRSEPEEDEDETPKATKRSLRSEPEEDEEETPKSSRRVKVVEEEDELPDDEEMKANSRRARRPSKVEEEEEDTAKATPRKSRTKQEELFEEDEEEDTSSRARKKLERLKPGKR